MSTEPKTKADAILGLCYPNVTKKQRRLLDVISSPECETLTTVSRYFMAMSAIYWFISREPSRVIIFCQGAENCEKVSAKLIEVIGQSSIKLPIKQHRDCEFLKVIEKSAIATRDFILIRQATGEGMLGYVLPKTKDGLPNFLVIFYQVSEEDVAEYRQKTDTWADRTIIVNEEPVKPFDFNSLL